ncbi:MAG: glycosyltransferase [Tychonema bourrellyi B0820]|uniref:Glycosyl transferase family 2 n=1 Tax=Tychonema bourrellyi FEM_GT703 TaxID=2040638 RepID=A0A2G4F218_9CYAN|nr:glycosyltransferase [Tychonema bourrellyi]MDQ2098255.1 glycosyltransferase [Tychonema bourrellyi B0820]PHX55814.1 glycosyl transferase family 2 [Tychonema bourrellyi FEM_GT703]
MAIKVMEIEFTEEINPIRQLEEYEGVRILVCYRGRPRGWAYVSNNPWEQTISADRVRQTIVDQLGKELVRSTLREEFGAVSEAVTDRHLPPISVVICTRDRTDLLKGALEAILALDYPHREIIVIDNAPANNSTAELVALLPVRYVKEERPGLDWARNRGIAEARHEIIAFTDDDVRPDRGWLRGIAAGFADPEIMAVSGLVAAAELETVAQQQFELIYGGMLQYLDSRKTNGSELSVQELLWASNYGVGANMAFRRQVFETVGNFDVALDVGTATRGCGDIEIFHRILAKGYATVYEPRAFVWHLHRRTDKALSKQLQDNGRGFGAYLLTCDRNRTVPRLEILKFAMFNWFGWWLVRRLKTPGLLPRHLVVSELLGALGSPFAYGKAQLQAQQLAELEPQEQPQPAQPVVGGVR